MSGMCLFNEKTVGTSALLAELELRSGLSCKAEPTALRVISYRIALKKYLALHQVDQTPFFADSFSVDDLGVASELLKWRDALVLSGWNSAVTGISDKIDQLAIIERIFKSDKMFRPGEADRWIKLCDFTDGNTVLDGSDTIIVLSDSEALLPVVRKTLENMHSKGLNVEYRSFASADSGKPSTNIGKFQAFLSDSSKSHEWAEGDTSLSIVHFRDTSSLYEWAASHAGNDGYDVTVCPDAKLMNENLMVFGKPVVDSMTENSNPQILQLMNLGISLFYRPLDINNLLSYLLIPVNPLPGGLRVRLIRALVKDNGLGETWKSVFEGDDRYIFVNDEKSEGESEKREDSAYRKRKMKFISMVMDNNHSEEDEDGQMISRDALKDYVTALLTWSYGRCSILQSDDSSQSAQVREQLIGLNAICDAFVFLIGQEEEWLSRNKIAQWLSHIYSPGTFTHKKALAGSIETVGNIHDITDNPDSLLWLGCNGDDSSGDIYSFLSQEEKDNLENKGMQFLSHEKLIRAERNDIKRAICSIGRKLTIVYADKDYGEAIMKHHVLSLVAKAFGMNDKNIPDIQIESPQPEAEFVESRVFNDFGKKELQEGFEGGLLKNDPDHDFSFSQLDKLIQRPFQYVIEYMAALKDTGSQGLAEMPTVLGTLAHKYVTYLVDLGKGTSPFTDKSETDFGKDIDDLAMEYASMMLLEENRIAFTTYKKRLYQSIRNLGKIISDNGFEIVESEHECCNTIDGLGKFIGYIDLLLKSRDGRYIIFDLKWSEGDTYYKKIAENKAAQLRIYEELLRKEGKEVCFTAYYNLLMGQLLINKADDSKLSSHENVISIKCDDSSDLLEKLKASFDFRLEQLENGIVEDAEGMKTDNLEYALETAEKNLYPLETGKNKEKYFEYGNKNRILRGDLE